MNAPLRVLHIIGGGDTGGALAHLLPLLAALRQAGCDARLLCLGSGGLAEAARDRGLPVEVLPMGAPWDARILPALRRRLFRGSWDVVHTHGMRANLPVRLLFSLPHGPRPGRSGPAETGGGPTRGAGAAGGPCLFTTVHSDLSLDYGDPLRRRLFPALDRLTSARVDRVLCVSEDLRRRLAARGFPPGRLAVVRSGLELEQAGRAPASCEGEGSAPTGSGRGAPVDAALTEVVWGGRAPAEGAPRLGTVARLVPVKAIDLFLEVAALVRRAFPEMRAAVVGDGPERSRLLLRARELGLEGVVTFPGDVRPGARAMREFDVFLLTSMSEGIPITVLEAMAAGLPVVATAVGGMAEAVVDGVTGALVRPRADRAATADALAEATLVLLRDPSAARRRGAAGAARVLEVFSAAGAAEATIVAYRECLAGAVPLTGEA